MENNWLVKYKKEKEEQYDHIAMPIYKRLGPYEFELHQTAYDNKDKIDAINSQDVYCADIGDARLDAKYEAYYRNSQEYGVHEKFNLMSEANGNTGYLLHIKKHGVVNSPISIAYHLDRLQPEVIDHHIIIAEAGSEATIILDYQSKDEEAVSHNGLIKLYAKDGARLKVVFLQRLNKHSSHIHGVISQLGRDSSLEVITINLGGSYSLESYKSYLEGDGSNSSIQSVYMGSDEQRLDMEYSMIHTGRRTQSDILVRGALRDNARKIFRGNLAFKKGADKSKGNEEEFTILLDPTVKADSIPALFCEEHDVEGNHAASAGQIDENKLFYLMSRGLTEKEAKKMIVEASFQTILDKLQITALKEEIQEEIRRRFTDE